MKKIFVWMLCAVMLVSLTACGKAAPEEKNPAAQGGTGGSANTPVPTQKPAGTDATPEPAGADGGNQDTSTGKNKIEAFLSGITLAEIPYIFGTFWDFTGGYVNGKELEADEVAAIKEEKTYVMFNFPDDKTALLEWGGGTSIRGEYSVRSDGTLGMTMDDNGKTVQYAAAFTNVDDKLVMILFLDENAETVWYFTQYTDVE